LSWSIGSRRSSGSDGRGRRRQNETVDDVLPRRAASLPERLGEADGLAQELAAAMLTKALLFRGGSASAGPVISRIS
jgi:hypothetical protein